MPKTCWDKASKLRKFFEVKLKKPLSDEEDEFAARAAEEEKSSAQLSLWLLRPLKYPEKDELLCFNFLSASLKPLGSKREESSIKNAPALSVICLFLCVIIPRHLRLVPRGLLCARPPEKRPIKAS